VSYLDPVTFGVSKLNRYIILFETQSYPQRRWIPAHIHVQAPGLASSQVFERIARVTILYRHEKQVLLGSRGGDQKRREDDARLPGRRILPLTALCRSPRSADIVDQGTFIAVE
jgi:hypothetical protein